MIEAKKEQRQEMLSLRRKLSQKDIIAKSNEIKSKLFDSAKFKAAQSIIFFVSFKNEVRTEAMIKEALDLGKRVIVPITNIKENKLELSELKDYDQELTEGTYGILEPKQEYRRPVNFSNADLVICPGLAFDRKGNRLGYGGGYYDRLLTQDLTINRVAICFDFQIINKVVVDEYDIKMNKIISESRELICY
ncbi:5-formyltetrahydrofolate cyclo-ligase [Orenia metallireducens]|uniref:5-formyltetrahydrofolate cyclo-ligase n=1 Tax=Orenia metallireducens TaxID=1413210 RepID=A0A285GBG2_9FIRM|nr:5-formyltetrahydrofolate cyclo-ligase [Orenia metallireducens]PRX24220.1 5-formyltetrahydrofolate cyclo-ligase [Orenia metallireducens]SNY19836.1 5-formyltetrahydrofolate cyclo-ligase [Orenia metallireducens]